MDTGSQKIWFGTTHLGTVTDNCANEHQNTARGHCALISPSTHPGIGFKGAVQAEEAKQLTKFLANLPPANPSGQDYVIITGDFNSDPTSEAIGTAPPLQCCRSCNNLPHPLPGNMLKGDQIELTDSWPHCSYGVHSLLPLLSLQQCSAG